MGGLTSLFGASWRLLLALIASGYHSGLIGRLAGGHEGFFGACELADLLGIHSLSRVCRFDTIIWSFVS